VPESTLIEIICFHILDVANILAHDSLGALPDAKAVLLFGSGREYSFCGTDEINRLRDKTS
jgi:hypothetical protein